MKDGHIERLLLAESDFEAAQGFRAVAEKVVTLYQVELDLQSATGGYTSGRDAYPAWAIAKRQLKELDRVCLRHAARRLDSAQRAAGVQSEMESETMFYDITHPIRVRARGTETSN